MTTTLKPVTLKGVDSAYLSALSAEWREPAWVLELRLQAFKNFEKLPWPTEKDERWKRTGLDSLPWVEIQLSPSFSSAATMELSDELRSHGVTWLALDEAMKAETDRLRAAWLAAIERASENKFLSFALALANAGGCLIVPKGETVKVPLHLPVSWSNLPGAKFPLNFIFIEEAGEAHVWEELSSGSLGNAAFVASYSGFHLKENARGALYSLQHWDESVWHFQFQDVSQSTFSRFNGVAVSMGGHVFHNELTVHLEGQGAENKVLGVIFGDGEQNFENWITQRHTAPKTISDIQYRGALKGSAHSFFSGLVSISKEAQQSDAFQSSKSLLLSRSARADAIPNLEILADDVKCSHGAAVGPVDEDQKYYLQTRGIPPSEAEEIIIEGFFEPVIAEVPSPAVQEQLRNFVEEKLRR